jgi:hypothetical protein
LPTLLFRRAVEAQILIDERYLPSYKEKQKGNKGVRNGKNPDDPNDRIPTRPIVARSNIEKPA